MKDPRIKKLASLILDHSVSIRKGDKLLVEGSYISLPLIKELYKQALIKEAHPYVSIKEDSLRELFFEHAKKEQLEYIHEYEWLYKPNFDARIVILSETNTKIFSNIDPSKEKIARMARKKLTSKVRSIKRWNICIYPTLGYAQDAEMSLEKFEDFVFDSCYCGYNDPVAQLKKDLEWQRELRNKLQQGENIRIVAKGTDISMSVSQRLFCVEEGTVNLPTGEIFVGPVEDSVNGEIKFSYPLIFGGRVIDGIWLKFKDGKVIDYNTRKNKKAFTELLTTDEGAKFVGELGIGTNPFVTKFCNNLLLDEKILGTIHLALGQSYEETLGKNKSSIHIDMVCDMRQDGIIYLDEKPIQKNGKFI